MDDFTAQMLADGEGESEFWCTGDDCVRFDDDGRPYIEPDAILFYRRKRVFLKKSGSDVLLSRKNGVLELEVYDVRRLFTREAAAPSDIPVERLYCQMTTTHYKRIRSGVYYTTVSLIATVNSAANKWWVPRRNFKLVSGEKAVTTSVPLNELEAQNKEGRDMVQVRDHDSGKHQAAMGSGLRKWLDIEE